MSYRALRSRSALAVLALSLAVSGIAAPGFAEPTPSSPTPSPTPSSTPSATTTTPTTTPTPTPSEASSSVPQPTPSTASPAPEQQKVPSDDQAPQGANEPTFTRDDSPVRLRWLALGGEAGWVGALTSDERVVRSGLEARFVGADILSASATGPAYAVKSSIRTRYRSFGGPTSMLGFPTTDQQAISEVAGATRSEFTSGAIVWSAKTGAHPVYRSFWTKYRSLAKPYTTLGLPTATQTAGIVPGSQKQTFTAGTLLWTAKTGSHLVRGAIRTRYNALGAEKYLGVPVTDEYAVGNNLQQKFTQGMITWTRATGATAVQANYKPYLTGVAGSVDARSVIGVKGYVLPRVGGVKVSFQIYRSGKFSHYEYHTTKADGSFTGSYSYLKDSLVTFKVRTGVLGYNKKWLYGSSYSVKRSAWQLATVRAVKSADVRYTYRAGCPVGPSQLRVIEMNYYGFDKKMHRGMIIVRKDKVVDVRNIFWRAMDARFPIKKMVNPNVYKGSDPASMHADNTSGFNCRHVTGNPYRMSPHSYGYAFDVNTVENPYFDGSKWWPSNGKAYIQGGKYNRSPLKKGSLASYSALTARATKRGWFWGGAWNPGRDWQHFEER